MAGLNMWAAANAGLLVMVLGAVALAALGLAVWLALRLRRTQRHYALLTRDTNGGNLAEVLEAHAEAVRTASARVAELAGRTSQVEADSVRYLQRVGFMRFNPFRDAGGDQSFALVLADQEGNGVVISSLHNREGTRVYGKPLSSWHSAYPLTDEERQAIARAKAPDAGNLLQ